MGKLVGEAYKCPNCGENREDKLEEQANGEILCTSCGMRYV